LSASARGATITWAWTAKRACSASCMGLVSSTLGSAALIRSSLHNRVAEFAQALDAQRYVLAMPELGSGLMVGGHAGRRAGGNDVADIQRHALGCVLDQFVDAEQHLLRAGRLH